VVELLKHPRLQLDAVDSARRTPVHFAVVEGGPSASCCCRATGALLLNCALSCVLTGTRGSADLAVRVRATNSTALDVALECKQLQCAALLCCLAALSDRSDGPSDADLPAAATAVGHTSLERWLHLKPELLTEYAQP
jgi:hypothetical protein